MARPIILVRDVMSPVPHSIGPEQSLSSAHERMKTLGVHHLPVLEGDRLVGILSDRDITAALGRPGDHTQMSVDVVMTPDPLTVGPDTELTPVVRSILDRRIGSVVVVEEGKVVGLVTTTDVLKAYCDALDPLASPGSKPSQVRKRILDEHAVLRGLIQRLRSQLNAPDERAEPARAQARHLLVALDRHIRLEDTLLGPALLMGDAFGEARKGKMEEMHHRQHAQIKSLFATIQKSDADSLEPEIQGELEQLLSLTLDDMTHEDELLLSEEVLSDDPIRVTFTG